MVDTLTQTVALACNTSRVWPGQTNAGMGGSTVGIVGYYNGRTYRTFLKGIIDWTNIQSVESAFLVFYTSDASEVLTWTNRINKVVVRMRKAAWTEGDSTTFAADEYVASNFYADQHTPITNVVAVGLNRINVTALVQLWHRLPASTRQTRSNMGFELTGTTTELDSFELWSDDAADGLRPQLEINYVPGATVPTVGSLAPSGTVDTLEYFSGVFTDTKGTDRLAFHEVEVYTSQATNSGETVTLNGGIKVYTGVKTPASAAELALSAQGTARHVPTTVTWLTTNTTFKFRMRVWDNENKDSLWSDLVSFKVSNTPPSPPTLSPANGAQLTSMNIDVRTGDIVDADGDGLFAYEFQLSEYPEGDPGWLGYIPWATGKQLVPSGATEAVTQYGGDALTTGTYYLRGRVWDTRDAVSDWAYVELDLLNDFEPLPQDETATDIQLRPRAPWRIRIREMAFNAVGGALTGNATTNVLTTASAHGLTVGERVRFSALNGGAGLVVGTTYYVKTIPSTTTFTVSATKGGAVFDFTTAISATSTLTKVTTRGPGNVVAILEDAKSVGATELYNSPGEAHWTLPNDHPQISAIEPKLTHYAIDFRQGEGWREVFAGLVWDFDANGRDVVFTGLDYLALFDRVLDERYSVGDPERDVTKGGSKYVEDTISYIIGDNTYGLIAKAKALTNSPVGFITKGAIATMDNVVSLFTTYQRTLTACVGLIDSYRSGANRRTRMLVRPTTSGYEVVVLENPGIVREDMPLRFGELVQGYRVIPYGNAWASQIAGIGRSRDGIGVMYKRASSFASDPSFEATYGHFVEPVFIDGVTDENDLLRRTRQKAVSAGTLGKSVGIGVRSGVLLPKDGYQLMDLFPVEIVDGPVDTRDWGSDNWMCVGVTWEAEDNGASSTVLTLRPEENGVAPSDDLLLARPSSTQAEWQVGYKAPNPLEATSKYWLNQSTGEVSERTPGIGYAITGTP